MATKKMTESWLKGLKAPADGRNTYHDEMESGLALRVGKTGRASWLLFYRNDGGVKRGWTFGTWPATSLKDARARARVERGRIEVGADPALEKQAQRKAGNVEQLAGLFIENYAQPKKKSWREDKRILDKDVLPVIGHMKVEQVTRGDINRVLDIIEKRGANVACNRALAVMSKMFTWAIGNDRARITSSPTALVEKRAHERPRERALAPQEISRVFSRLETSAMAEGTKLALRLQLLTLTRSGEVAGAKKREFDLEERLWTIPGERTKNKKTHALPLQPMALSIVERALALSPDTSPWLFPSPRNMGTSPITTRAISKAVRRNEAVLGVEHFQPHDLRRTGTTECRRLGFDPLHIDKILNHSERSLSGSVYSRYEYLAEKRLVLAGWEAHLAEVFGIKADGVVTPIARAGRV